LEGNCVLMACQAPYLAAGKLDSILSEVLTIGESDVILIATSLAEVDDRKLILELWSGGRAFITYSLQLKFGYWALLPHIIVVLAHPDLDVARTKLKKAYAMFLQTPKAEHHYFVILLFSEASQLFGDTQLFLNGGPMSPELKVIAGKFLLIKTAERSIERPHRISKMETTRAPHHGGAFISSRFRIPEIEAEINRDNSFLTDLAANLRLVWHPLHAAKELGLASHPLLHKICDPTHKRLPRLDRDKYRQQLIKLAYRTDPRVQYERYPSVAANIENAIKKMARARKETREMMEPSRDSDPDAVRAKYAMQHFQEHANLDKMHSVMNVPGSLRSLRESMSDPLTRSVTIKYIDEDADNDDGGDGDDACPIHLGFVPCFFKIVHRRPASQKVVNSVGFQVPTNTMAIAKVKYFAADMEAQTVQVSLSNRATSISDFTHTLGVEDMLVEGVDNIHKTLWEWQATAEVQYCLKDKLVDIDADVQDALLLDLIQASSD